MVLKRRLLGCDNACLREKGRSDKRHWKPSGRTPIGSLWSSFPELRKHCSLSNDVVLWHYTAHVVITKVREND